MSNFLLQRNLSLTRNDYQEARDQSNTAQHCKAAAEKELQETQSKAHAERRQADAKSRTLEVCWHHVLLHFCILKLAYACSWTAKWWTWTQEGYLKKEAVRSYPADEAAKRFRSIFQIRSCSVFIFSFRRYALEWLTMFFEAFQEGVRHTQFAKLLMTLGGDCWIVQCAKHCFHAGQGCRAGRGHCVAGNEGGGSWGEPGRSPSWSWDGSHRSGQASQGADYGALWKIGLNGGSPSCRGNTSGLEAWGLGWPLLIAVLFLSSEIFTAARNT